VPAQARPPCTPSIDLKLIIPCCDARGCRALREALAPDDKSAPSWLRIEERIEGDSLVVFVRAPLERGMSVRATIDEIIEYAYSLLKTVEKLGGCSQRSPS